MHRRIFRAIFNRDRLDLIVGIMFFLIMGFTGFITIVQSGESDIKKPALLPVRLETAENLKVGALVYILGVPQGYVRSFYFIQTHVKKDDTHDHEIVKEQYVLAVLALREIPEFREGYVIRTKFMEILGEKVVEIKPGREFSSPVLDVATLDLNRFLTDEAASVIPILPANKYLLEAGNYDDPLFQASMILMENRAPFREIISNLAEITGKLNQGSGNISALINSPRLMDGGEDTLKEIQVLVREFGTASEDTRETDSIINFVTGIIGFFL